MKLLDISDTKNVNEALEAIGADKPYTTKPVWSFLPDQVAMDGYKAIVDGNGKPLCINNDSYKLLQPIEAFSYVDDVRQHLGADFKEAGFLDNGRKLFIRAEIPETINVNPKVGDRLSFQLNFWTSFDGTMPSTFTMGWLRLVCSNGMTAMEDGQRARVRHTVNQHDRLVDAVADITGIKRTIEYNRELFETFQRTEMKDKDIDTHLNRWFKGESSRSKNTRITVRQLYRTGLGNKGESCWDLLNAITEYQQHHAVYRQTSSRSADENRFNSMELGRNRDFQRGVMNDLKQFCLAN